MSTSRAATAYKKQNGTLAIAKDRGSVSWTPSSPPDAVPAMIVSVANITNLQQTPEASAKVMLKIFAQNPGQTEAIAHVFTFTSPKEARTEANAIKDDLASLIQLYKQSQSTNSSSGAGQSAAMTIANAVSGRNSWEDDENLKSDTELQQSLLKSDPNLQETFIKALQQKPSSLSTTQFTSQFWASRIHLLRAHAIAKGQEKGKYNVFSSIGSSKRLDLTPDNIKAIFEQYPVVQRIYNEVTSPNSKRPENKKIKDVSQFWARFFQSKLYSSLRGMKISERDEVDHILDDYLTAPELTGLRPTSNDPHIGKFIDLEGNEENHSQRQGNRPDVDNRQSNLDKAPVIRKLNTISEKLMAAVKPSEIDVSAPIGMEEAEYESLRLRDLAGDPEQHRIVLNIRDQSRFFSSETSSTDTTTTTTNPFATLDPETALHTVTTSINTAFPHPGAGVIPIAPFTELDLVDDDSPTLTSGSTLATHHILSLIRTHTSQTAPIPATSGLPETIYTQLTLNHSTTLEFLRQFWSAFFSGDASRANEMSALVESLNSSLDRINNIASEADSVRTAEVKKAEASAAEMSSKTGRRRKVDYSKMPQGGKRVRELCGPLIEGLNRAVQEYKREFDLQVKELEMVEQRGGTPSVGTPA